jgi:hypothetical protein
MKTLEELIYEWGNLSGGTVEQHIYDYFQKYLGDTVASYEVDRINLVAMTIRKDQLEEWLQDYQKSLRETNVFHKNEATIHAITEILSE